MPRSDRGPRHSEPPATRRPKPFDPLDYDNLTANCVRELLDQPMIALGAVPRFIGAGVYALYYAGDFAVYADLDRGKPLYVGSKVPGGARQGLAMPTTEYTEPDLYGRLRQHAGSIAATNLSLEQFNCRYLVVRPVWILMVERFLIRHFHPLWNARLDGFGNHAPSRGRQRQVQSWWDILHPGRAWAAKLPATRTWADAEQRVREFLRASEEEQEALTIHALETGQADTSAP